MLDASLQMIWGLARYVRVCVLFVLLLDSIASVSTRSTTCDILAHLISLQYNALLHQTLQSVCLIWTLLQTGLTANKARSAKRVIVICPCSLVKNWDNEFVKWLGPGVVKTLALAESDRKTVEKNIDCFVKTKMFNVLIASYETIRTHVGRLTKYKDCCDLLVCDEAHRLKNRENQTSMALNSIPVKRRILLTGTPMQVSTK